MTYVYFTLEENYLLRKRKLNKKRKIPTKTTIGPDGIPNIFAIKIPNVAAIIPKTTDKI